MLPGIWRERSFGFDPQRIVEPALDQIDLQASVFEHDVISVGMLGIGHSGKNRPAARPFWKDPGGQRKLVEKAKTAHVASTEESSSVEFRSLTNLAGLVFGRAVLPARLERTAGRIGQPAVNSNRVKRQVGL